jgi:hypothetical protein
MNKHDELATTTNNLPAARSTAVELSLSMLADEANLETVRSKEAAGEAVECAIRAGERLAEAKDRITHGEWLPWLEANYTESARTAQDYMRLAAHQDALQQIRSSAAHFNSVREALKALAPPKEPDEPTLGSQRSEPNEGDPDGRDTDQSAWVDGFCARSIRRLERELGMPVGPPELARRMAALEAFQAAKADPASPESLSLLLGYSLAQADWLGKRVRRWDSGVDVIDPAARWCAEDCVAGWKAVRKQAEGLPWAELRAAHESGEAHPRISREGMLTIIDWCDTLDNWRVNHRERCPRGDGCEVLTLGAAVERVWRSRANAATSNTEDGLAGAAATSGPVDRDATYAERFERDRREKRWGRG